MAELKEIARWEGFGLAGLNHVAKELGRAMPAQGVVAVHGPMGAGKTTLIRALLAQLGVEEGAASPTFGLVHHHTASRAGQDLEIRHMDLYRMEDEEEAERSGVAELLQGRALNLVEWPERIPSLMPEDAWLLQVMPQPDGKRTCILWQLQE